MIIIIFKLVNICNKFDILFIIFTKITNSSKYTIMGQEIKTNETYYDSIIRQGYNRRDFLKFVAFIGAYMGVESSALGQIAKLFNNKTKITGYLGAFSGMYLL